MSDSKRLELAEAYWTTASDAVAAAREAVRRARAHPLSGDALEAAKAALTLAHELSVAYKHLLAQRSRTSACSLGGTAAAGRADPSLPAMLRAHPVNSYLSYSPVPPRTWHDAHADLRVRARARPAPARDRRRRRRGDAGARLRAGAAARARQSVRLPCRASSHIVLRYLQRIRALGQADRRRAGAPDGEGRRDRSGRPRLPAVLRQQGRLDRRHASCSCSRSTSRSRSRSSCARSRPAATFPTGVGKRPDARLSTSTLLRRLLRQWAIPPARQFNRLPSRARVVMCAGLSGVWQYSRGHARAASPQRADRPAADDQLPGDQPHARRLCAAPDRPGALPRCASAS